jgi:hypothetical protein
MPISSRGRIRAAGKPPVHRIRPLPEYLKVCREGLPIVVAQVDRTLAAPVCTAVIRDNSEMALGVKESGKRMRLGVAQPGGSREAAPDRGFTTGTSCHRDFSEVGT